MMKRVATAAIILSAIVGCSGSNDDDDSPVDYTTSVDGVETDAGPENTDPATSGGDVSPTDVTPDGEPASDDTDQPGPSSGDPGNDETVTDSSVDAGDELDNQPDMPADEEVGDASPIDTPSDDEAPEPDQPTSELPDTSAAITFDNHVELLAEVFAVYSGKFYRDTFLSLPGFAVPTYEEPPETESGLLISQPVEVFCDNGGTADIVPQYYGIQSDNLLAWEYEFDDCQDGAKVLDGKITREFYEGIYVIANGFSSTTQDEVIQLTGRTILEFGTLWNVRGTRLSIESGTSRFVLSEFDFGYSGLADGADVQGNYVVEADWTNGARLSVDVLADAILNLSGGQLRVSAGEDNFLVLNASTGDPDTVEVTLAVGGVSDTFIEPWSDTWTQSLQVE